MRIDREADLVGRGVGKTGVRKGWNPLGFQGGLVPTFGHLTLVARSWCDHLTGAQQGIHRSKLHDNSR